MANAQSDSKSGGEQARSRTPLTRVLDVLSRLKQENPDSDTWRTWAAALEFSEKDPEAVARVARSVLSLRADFLAAEEMMASTRVRKVNYAAPFDGIRPLLGVELLGQRWKMSAQHLHSGYLAQLRGFDDLLPTDDVTPGSAQIAAIRDALDALLKEVESDVLDLDLRAFLISCVRRMQDAVNEWRHLGVTAVRRAAAIVVEEMRIRFDLAAERGAPVPSKARSLFNRIETIEKWIRRVELVARLWGYLAGPAEQGIQLPPFREPLALPPGTIVVQDSAVAEDKSQSDAA